MNKFSKVLTIFSFILLVQHSRTSPPNMANVKNGPIASQDTNLVVKNQGASNGVSPSGTLGFLSHFFDIKRIKEFIQNLGSRLQTGGLCLSCKFVAGHLQHQVKNGATEDDVKKTFSTLCTTFRFEKPDVCAGFAELHKNEVITVLANVDPNEVCAILISGCGDVINALHNWTVPMTPLPKPPFQLPQPPKPGSPVTRVLHISDTHVDLHYREGSNANCGKPLCCRLSSGVPATPSDAAGYWGSYGNCDIPLRTLETMLAHINKTHKIDYVIWTGDIPPHNVWYTTRKEVVHLLYAAVNLIHKYLGHIPIFPALGNHESSPVNSFPIPQIKGKNSISWLYDEVAKTWMQWLPDSSLTLKKGGYYSVPVSPGFRIISLNMNYCNRFNWWLLLNSTDPTGELAWFVTELQKAEDKGEKVHILGHIPPGTDDCFPVWSENYHKIINRYESTVTAQFFGHNHRDEFEVFYDDKSAPKPRATNIAYIGPSVTTYDGVNPGYRIYIVDGNYPGSSRLVLDHESYYMNLTEANMNKKAEWRFEYSAKAAFNMTSLLPSEWDKLIQRFQKNDTLFQKFYRFYVSQSDYLPRHCDGNCKTTILCNLRRSQSNDPFVC